MRPTIPLDHTAVTNRPG